MPSAGVTPSPLADRAAAAAWFGAPLCRNCGAIVDAPFCGRCGQKRATRLSLADAGREGWERLRVFDKDQARTLGTLIVSPGRVARDYVLGRRAAYIHPLKLLVALVAVLVLVLAANRYFAAAGADGDVARMADRVMAYANWSFTLGIFAILLGSILGFGRRLGYNAIEHGVLAVYCQNLILAIVILNLLPTLVWRDPAFVQAHRQASAYYLYPIKLAVVAVGYAQFFRLRLAHDWPRLALACCIYLAASWALLRVYAAAILLIVSRTA